MINHLRSEDRIKLAVRLESTWANRIRYMVVVYTSGHQDTEENVLLGMDFSAKESNTCTIGMVLPLWSDTTIHLDGDGGFSVSTASRIHIFKPVSVQAMWSALQILHKSCEIARRYNYYPSGIALTWTSYYESCISSDQSCINEWNAMKDLQSTRPDSPALFVDKPTENELTERLIKTKLRCLMMSRDLENVTSKEIRNELEQQMTCNLKEYKGFIDNEMLTILGQMDKASLIFDHLYLGSEWNASNLEELQGAGVGYILNVTREIDNFFSGLFDYHNIRVFDEDTTDLLSFWNDTYNFITKAKKNHSKCLVHCKMGVSRSASTVIAYAMKEYGWSLERAYKYVKEKRSIAQPNTGFMKQLAEYEGILDASKQRHNSLWRRNSDGDLQETVRDGTFSSGRSLSNQDDESSGDPETPQTCGKQISEPPRRQGLAKDPTQAVNSNYYFRCLSDPSENSAEVNEDTPFALSEPSNGQLVEDNHKVPRVCCNEGKNAKQMIYNQEMERSKVQSYLMQHQESILQLQKAGLVRKHTKELERLTYLRSSSKREASETKRGTYVKDEAIDLFAQDPVADIQDQAQSYEDVENNVVPEANFEDYPLPDGVYQKTSTPCISGRSGTGFLTKERLQQICATLITSPHATSLTRSSSSDSIHSIRGQPGLVELRTQEIEARMRQAGLTVCSEMKRSHSLAKLASLNLSSEDLSREKEAENLMLKSSHVKLAESLLLHNVVERMCWNTNLHREMEIQTGQLSPVKPLNQSIELSGSVSVKDVFLYMERKMPNLAYGTVLQCVRQTEPSRMVLTSRLRWKYVTSFRETCSYFHSSFFFFAGVGEGRVFFSRGE
uniref:protein-serine/threonine phosphatase n=1 Tax=Callorhinchus milii TaxID=7868 RepID=A0A4W3JI72_CALMI